MHIRESLKLSVALTLALSAGSAGATDLLQVYQVSKQNDPQIAAAQAAHQAALEARPQARSLLRPNVTLSGNVTHINTNYQEVGTPLIPTGTRDYNTNGYTLSLQYPLYHRDYWVQQTLADSRIAQADAQFAAAQQGLALRVAQAYFNLLSAQDNLTTAEAEQRAIERQLHQVKQRFEVGLSAITDVREAQARHDLALAQTIAARNQIHTARERVRELTGGEFGELEQVGEEVPLVVPEPADIDKWVEAAMKGNFQLIAAQAGTETARAEVERRSGTRYPTVDLIAQHAYNDTLAAPGFGAKTSGFNAAVQVTVPLYTGGRTSSQIREAEYSYNQAQAQLEQARRATESETRTAYLNVTLGISQVQALRQSVESAQTALSATQAGYEVGTRTVVEVLDAQRQLFRAQRDYSAARYNYLLATLQLKQAAGILAEEDLRVVNSWLK